MNELSETDWYRTGHSAYYRDLLLTDNEARCLNDRANWTRGWLDAKRDDPYNPDRFDEGT